MAISEYVIAFVAGFSLAGVLAALRFRALQRKSSPAQIVYKDADTPEPALPDETASGFSIDSAVLIEQILDTSTVVYFIYDIPGKRLGFISRSVTRVIGIKPSKLMAMNAPDLINLVEHNHQKAVQEHYASIMERNNDSIAEVLYPIVRPDGAHRWLLLRDRIFKRDVSGKPEQTFGVALDVTEFVESRQRLIESRNEAHIASQAKDEFLAVISHELHTPLNAIAGAAQLLIEETDEIARSEYMEMIISGANSLEKLFRDLIEFTQIQSGDTPLREAINLHEDLDVIFAQAQSRAEGSGLIWSIEKAPDIPAELYGDRSRLFSILRQLLDNALKFTEKGSICCRIHPGSSHPDDIVIEVEDTGIGISESVREAIFEPFRQLESSRARKYEGTGLGLAIVRRMVDAMEGTIEIESQEGKGSLFRVTVRLDSEPE